MPKPMILKTDKKCTLVVTPDVHEAVVHYAQTNRLTLQEATQKLLEMAIVKVYGVINK